MRVLIVGCGYVGLPLGAELVKQGHEVFGLRRSADGEAELVATQGEANAGQHRHGRSRRDRAGRS